MTEQLERRCPVCEDERSFRLAARTHLHLGTKRKWSCEECDHGFVRIDGEVDTGEPA